MTLRDGVFAVLFFFLGTLSVGVAYAAWTGPTEAPPNGNVPAPINVGTTGQVKNGGLGLNTLTVFGNSLFGGSTGSNAYINFGPTSGASGYGIRDNAGTLEFKNSGGDWASLQSTLYTLCGGDCGGGGTPPYDIGRERVVRIVPYGSAGGWYYANCSAGKKTLGGSCSSSNGTVGHSDYIEDARYGCYTSACPSCQWSVVAICADVQ